jgi:hypothetical protein
MTSVNDTGDQGHYATMICQSTLIVNTNTDRSARFIATNSWNTVHHNSGALVSGCEGVGVGRMVEQRMENGTAVCFVRGLKVEYVTKAPYRNRAEGGMRHPAPAEIRQQQEITGHSGQRRQARNMQVRQRLTAQSFESKTIDLVLGLGLS